MKLLAAIGIVFALLFATASPAAAQGKPSAASRKKARERYEKAKAFQEAGRYTEAIAEYEGAYTAVPDPAFLYNVARCLHLSGEREKAIEKYDAYLAERPTGEIADEAKSFAADLRAQIASEKEAAAAREAREAEEKERASKLAPERAVQGEPASDGARPLELTRRDDRPAPARSTARRVVWISAGVGLVGAGALIDTLPDSGHNGTLEATDFVPVGLYLAGLAAVSLGIF